MAKAKSKRKAKVAVKPVSAKVLAMFASNASHTAHQDARAASINTRTLKDSLAVHKAFTKANKKVRGELKFAWVSAYLAADLGISISAASKILGQVRTKRSPKSRKAAARAQFKFLYHVARKSRKNTEFNKTSRKKNVWLSIVDSIESRLEKKMRRLEKAGNKAKARKLQAAVLAIIAKY